jgi:hypothetical protein
MAKAKERVKITAQVTLRGRFPRGALVRLYAASPSALRHSEGDELLAAKKVGDDQTVTFTNLDGVAVGGRYIAFGYINGTPVDLRLRGRAPGDESLGQPPVGVEPVKHADGTVAAERGQAMAGSPTDRPAIPPHPDPSEKDFQQDSSPPPGRPAFPHPFPEDRPAVPFHPEPGKEG